MSLRALAFEPEKHFLKVLDGFLYLSLAAQEILENLARQIDLESAFVVFVQQISVVLCEYISLENYINNFTINYRPQPLLHIISTLSIYCVTDAYFFDITTYITFYYMDWNVVMLL